MTCLQRGQPQRSTESKSVGLALEVSIHSGRENEEEKSTDQNSILLTSVGQFQGTYLLSRVTHHIYCILTHVLSISKQKKTGETKYCTGKDHYHWSREISRSFLKHNKYFSILINEIDLYGINGRLSFPIC